MNGFIDVVESVSRANLAYDGEIDCSLTILQCYSVLITIDFEQYQKLKDVDQLLPTLLQDLNIRLPCEFTHQNIEGEIYCNECTPNGPDWE
jgi:hypothetical protein